MRDQGCPPKIDIILDKFRKTLRTKRDVSKDHRDYILIKELYHCTPNQLDEVDEHTLHLHYMMLMLEREEEFLENKRNEQRAKQRNSFPKQR